MKRMNDADKVHPFPEAQYRGAPRPEKTPADMAPGLRVKSGDYGVGTVVALLPIGVQIHWDEPLLGTQQHLLVLDTWFAAQLERVD